MKKRKYGILLAAALVLTQAVTVFAAGSKTADVALAGESVGAYEVLEGTAENFSYLQEDHGQVLEAILKINAGEAKLESIAEMAPELETELKDRVMVTPFFDLKPVNGGIKTADGKYLVTLEVPSLTTKMVDVKLLHYSTVRNVWEIVTPTDVNYSDKTITAEFEDLSPVAVIAKEDPEAEAAVGTSPQTGRNTVWPLWISAGVVLGLLGAGVYRKSKAE